MKKTIIIILSIVVSYLYGVEQKVDSVAGPIDIKKYNTKIQDNKFQSNNILVTVKQQNNYKLLHGTKSTVDDLLINDDMLDGNASQSIPSIASDNMGRSILVWVDSRNENSDMYFQRINFLGKKIGECKKVNNTDGGMFSQTSPDVAASMDGKFVVVWTDYRNGNINPDIYGQLYFASGIPRGENFKVNNDIAVEQLSTPAIAMDRMGNFVVVWADRRNGNSDIFYQLYKESGVPIGTNIKANSDTGTRTQYAPDVARQDGGDFAIVWVDERNGISNPDIYYQRYKKTGIPIDVNVKINMDIDVGHQYSPSIADGKNGDYIFAWEDTRNGNSDIYYRRFHARTNSMDPSDMKVNDDVGTSTQTSPSIGIDDQGNFQIVWEDKRNSNPDIYFRRYTVWGLPGASVRVNDDVGNAVQAYPDISVSRFLSNGYFIICWQDNRNKNVDIYFNRYDAFGHPVASNISVNDDTGIATQNSPATAINNSGNIVIVWEDVRSRIHPGVYCQRLDATGTPVGGNIQVDDDSGSEMWSCPASAMDENDNFIVVWLDHNIIYFQRYDQSGTPQGGKTRVSDTDSPAGECYPSVVMHIDGSFVITWNVLQDFDTGDIYCKRFDSLGNALCVDTQVDVFGGLEIISTTPVIAIDRAGSFVIAWSGAYESPDIYTDIWFCRYNSNGEWLQGPSPTNEVGPILKVVEPQPSVAMDGSGNFVIGWIDYRNSKSCIYCQFYNSDGIAYESGNIKVNDSDASNLYDSPSVAMDGFGNVFIVWEDYRNGLKNPNVFSQQYSIDGTILGTNKQIIVDGPNYGEKAPNLMAKERTIVCSWQDNRRSMGWDIFAKILVSE